MNRHPISRMVWAAVLLALAGCNVSAPTATTTPSAAAPTPSSTPSPTPSSTPSPSPTASAPSGALLPDGTWQAEITAEDLTDAGWTVDDLSPGTYTFTIAGAQATLEALHETGHTDFCEAEMSVLGDHVKFDYDPAGGDCGDLMEVVDWELKDDGLHLALISTTGGYPESQKAQLETVPWQRVEGSVSTVEPGMVDIGGRSLFMECRGAGTPTVVFLQGTRMSSRSMRGIEDALLDEGPVRVCNFDRAGEGRSDPAAEQQDDIDVVDDLSALLAAAQIDPPYVLVGHSVGGDQTWLYADRHPEGVAGFMLMNAGFFELDWDSLHDVWSQAEIDAERAHSEEILGSVKQAATPPEGVPYVVMMSTIAQCESPNDLCGRIYPKFEDWGRELAGRTGSGRLVSVDAGHEIYLTELDRVVEELQLLIDETRST